jgi:uncharacterized protein (TIGR03437 family)
VDEEGYTGVPVGDDEVFKVTPDGIITAFAGSGFGGSSPNLGDGGAATSASFSLGGLAIDASGNVYIADTIHNRIRKVSTTGIITTFAGNGSSNYSGDGGPAIAAGLNLPFGVAVDAAGNLYVADTFNYRVRKVTSDGIITSIAGTGKPGSSGNGVPATDAAIGDASALAVAAGGGIYITDGATIRLLTPTPSAPTITSGGVVPVDSPSPTIQPGEWVSIYGTNLASGTATWTGNFPISLAGTSVTIDGKAAFLSFVSPGQINLQAPNDTATGPVRVTVTTASGSVTATVTLAQFAPSFLLLDAKHVAGIILRSNGSGAYGGGAYDIVGPTGTSLGYATVAAKAGDIVALFGTGFGPTSPAVLAGQAFSETAATTSVVNLLINNVSVTPLFAGLSGAGLDQINLTVPAGLGTGDVLLVATVGGVQTPPGVVISLQ